MQRHKGQTATFSDICEKSGYLLKKPDQLLNFKLWVFNCGFVFFWESWMFTVLDGIGRENIVLLTWWVLQWLIVMWVMLFMNIVYIYFIVFLLLDTSS